jgi:tRNA(Ile)-lysidine synthase
LELIIIVGDFFRVLLEEIVLSFLKKHIDPSKPILLGLSGGADSLCLLHLLIRVKSKIPFSLHIAHIDHGWRFESEMEAEFLREEAAKLSLPFHLKRLDPKNLSGNLENACREERLKFFKEICYQENCQAVLLAHHADDQSETVLKRIFEGASLPNLSGLRNIQSIYGINLWRPLLSITKKEIQEWLELNSLTYFDDSTNRDPKYLRARLRDQVIPKLSEQFGKKISSTLWRIGLEAQELHSYLDEKVKFILQKQCNSSLGTYLDLTGHQLHKVEVTHLIRKLCLSENLTMSSDTINALCKLICEGSGNKQIIAGDKIVFVDRRRIFFVNPLEEIQKSNCPLIIGKFEFGNWEVNVESINIEKKEKVSTWCDAWNGSCSVILPHGNYELGYPTINAPYAKRGKINKWWSDHKIPFFLRKQIPVIWENGTISHEFLTGKIAYNTENQGFKVALYHKQCK